MKYQPCSLGALFVQWCRHPSFPDRLLRSGSTGYPAGVLARHIAEQSRQLHYQYAPNSRLAIKADTEAGFAASLFAIWHAGHIPVLLPNLQPGTRRMLADHYDALIQGDHPALRDRHGSCLSPARLTLSAEQQLIFFTSGTTGKPRAVTRRLHHLDREIAALEQQFGEQLGHSIMYSTVSVQHVYGLIFSLLWPLSTGRPAHFPPLQYPEALHTLPAQHACYLVSSPAFLKRLDQAPARPPQVVFSSGGALGMPAARAVARQCATWPIEILGSTETGGIAWRQTHNRGNRWHPLPGVRIDAADEKQPGQTATAAERPLPLVVHSAFSEAGQCGHTTDDSIIMAADGTFTLAGRGDRIVKIEEKRLSLQEMEARLSSHRWIETAAVLALSERRQYVAAVIVPTTVATRVLQRFGKRRLNRLLQQWLLDYYERPLLPKRFRYVTELPFNAQGKLTTASLKALFE